MFLPYQSFIMLNILSRVNEALMLGTAEQRQAVAAAAVAAVSQQHPPVF
jgi:hypothetical protein